MKLLPIVATVALLGTVGLALAAPAGTPDDSAFTVDLLASQGHSYFIYCSNGSKAITACPSPSLWENANDLDGLQRGNYWTGPTKHEPDQRLLG